MVTDEMTSRYRAQIARGVEFESGDPLGDQIRKFEEQIGLRTDPMLIAYEQHKRFMQSQGKEWDSTPVAPDAGEDRWWDRDVEFTSMAALNQAQTKRG